MTVEIGALLSKDFGQKALETLIDFEAVSYTHLTLPTR